MRMFGQYLWAVIRFWWAVIPGIVVVVWDLFERGRGRPLGIHRQIKLGIVLVGLCVAQFLAYREERLARDGALAQLRARPRLRRLSADSMHALRVRLSDFKGSFAQISIGTLDDEGMALGRQLQQAFAAAGWSTANNSDALGGAPVTHLRIFTDYRDERAVSAVQRALEELQLPYSIYRVCNGTALSIEIGAEKIQNP